MQITAQDLVGLLTSVQAVVASSLLTDHQKIIVLQDIAERSATYAVLHQFSRNQSDNISKNIGGDRWVTAQESPEQKARPKKGRESIRKKHQKITILPR